MKKFFILDGSGYLFRAYHALPELTNDEGKNVNAIYGFFRMILKLLKDRPEYFLITWDHPHKTLRKESFIDYKANRPEIADEFKWQIWKIKNIVKDIEFPHLEISWYEADDIINTIVKKFKNEKDLSLYIISSDKDLKQLIEKNVFFYEAMKSQTFWIEEFKQDYGFEPSNILDYLSLLWDSSDNIPWVNWIWKKTAKDLIVQYKDLENIYKNLDQLKDSIKIKLENNKETALQSKDLIKLYEVPDLDKNDLKNFSTNFDIDKFEKIITEEYNFKSISKNLNSLKNLYKWWEQLSLF